MSHDKDQKTLSKEDAELWAKVQKTIDPKAQDQTIAKLPKTPETEDFAALFAASEKDELQQEKKQPASGEHKTVSFKKTQQAQTKVEPFDHKKARKLSSGKQEIEAMIDLHGLTQRQAHSALINFLKNAQSQNHRHVLVITGKGKVIDKRNTKFDTENREPGVLKRVVPNWLDEMPELVQSHTTSHQRHGGEGALYVYLRKSKT